MPEPTAVICGATAGVGRASAEAFARAGYRVALIARGEQGLSDTQAQLEALGARVLAIAADVADAPALEAAATRVEAELGPIDVWVNAAMATVFGPFSALTPEEIRRVTEVTYLGSVHGTLTALRHMRPRNRGTIVQVGSALSYRAIPLQSAYCGAKFAIRGFIDSLRCELIHDRSGIRLSMVQLPAHNTPQFDWARNKVGWRAQPVPPIHTPEVAARAVLRAAREAPRELWVGTASLKAIIGTLFMPGLLDRMLARQAWDGQLIPEREPEGRPDNLFEPVEGLHATEGRFGDQAKPRALALSAASVGKLALGAGSRKARPAPAWRRSCCSCRSPHSRARPANRRRSRSSARQPSSAPPPGCVAPPSVRTTLHARQLLRVMAAEQRDLVAVLQRQRPQPVLIGQPRGAIDLHHALVEAQPRRAMALVAADLLAEEIGVAGMQ